MDFKELAISIHENTIEKGFADPILRRPIHQHIALQHSEVSEILEEHRNLGHTETIYNEKGKPLGVPSEVADVVIRVADFLVEYDLINEFQASSLSGWTLEEVRI